MNFPPLTPDLLHEILEELTGFHDTIQLRSNKLITLVKLFNLPQWHLESPNLLWRIKPWQISQERRIKLQQATDIYNSILHERKEAFEKLIAGLRQQMGIERDMAIIVASKIMQNKNVNIGLIYGVDISELPELPAKHHVIEEGKIVYEL